MELIMNSRFSKTVLSLLLLPVGFFLTSCFTSPAPVYRLKPLAEESRWHSGQEFVKSRSGDIEITAAFDRTVGGYLVFDVEIANLSGQQVLTAPENFYYLPMPGKNDTIVSPGKYIYAINPEQKLLEIDKEIAQETANYASAVGTDAAISILELFSDAAAIGKTKTNEEIEREQREDIEREVSQTNTEISHQTHMNQLSDARENWEMLPIRKTTLDPDYFINGKIYFPARQNAPYLKLCLPVGKSMNIFVFEMKKY